MPAACLYRLMHNKTLNWNLRRTVYVCLLLLLFVKQLLTNVWLHQNWHQIELCGVIPQCAISMVGFNKFHNFFMKMSNYTWIPSSQRSNSDIRLLMKSYWCKLHCGTCCNCSGGRSVATLHDGSVFSSRSNGAVGLCLYEFMTFPMVGTLLSCSRSTTLLLSSGKCVEN